MGLKAVAGGEWPHAAVSAGDRETKKGAFQERSQHCARVLGQTGAG